MFEIKHLFFTKQDHFEEIENVYFNAIDFDDIILGINYVIISENDLVFTLCVLYSVHVREGGPIPVYMGEYICFRM